jgi:hypothetical protein
MRSVWKPATAITATPAAVRLASRRKIRCCGSAFLHTLTMEAQLLARACGKTNIHSLEPEDLAALTMEASAMCKVPLAGTNYTVGMENGNYHKY